MPNWEPAVVNKETVSTKQTLPVMFINKNDHE